MTDVQNDDTQSPDNSIDDKESIIEDLKKQLDSLKNKTGELLAETKAAKERARAEAAAKEQAKLDKAKKEGDYEQLLQSSEKDRKRLAEELEGLRGKVSSEKVKSESLRIASELADGHNAELLSEFIKNRIKYTDEGIKVLDNTGQLTVSTLDQLKQEFAASEKYKSLVRGVKSSGGSAQGSGDKSVPSSKQVDRPTFDSWDAQKKSDFMLKDKGIVIDID